MLAYDVCNKLHSPMLTEAYLSKEKIKTVYEEISRRNDEYIEQSNNLQVTLNNIEEQWKKANSTSNFWFVVPIAGWSYLLIQKNKTKKLQIEQIQVSQMKDTQMKGIK